MNGSDPQALYATALHTTSPLSGYYHHNVPVESAGGTVLVRIPLPGAEQMDLRVWPEHEVLALVAQYAERVPALRHVSADPPFQVQDFVPGTQLNALAPRGAPVPPGVLPAVVRLFTQLAAVPVDRLPALPPSWPADGQCTAFARLLSDFTQRVHDEHEPGFAALWRALGVPPDPLRPVVAAWPALTSRPFHLLHADLHRRNMIVTGHGVVFVDWELALWGDPVYDLAVHLHKMGYRQDEACAVLDGWAAAFPASARAGWRADLAAYLCYERVKAALVHTVRYAREFAADDTTEPRRAVLAGKLTADLNAARPLWGGAPAWHPPDVDRLLRGWA